MTVLLVVAGLTSLCPAPAVAEIIDAHARTDNDRVILTASSSPVYRVGGRSGPVCSWVPLRLDRDPVSEDFTEEDIPFSPDGVGPEYVFEDGSGAVLGLFRVSCPDGSVTDRLVPVGVTPGDLLPGLRDRVEGLVPVPVLAVNPPVGVGGVVNVGLWLAVVEQSVVSLSAEAGAVWITLSPRLVSTRYDLGNGDRVVCAGVGVPIESVHPDLDVVGESPWCGYTYRVSSPEDDPYRLTVTAVWELPFTSSGGDGSIPALERSVTVDYDVDEIQTVGIAG